MDEGEGGVEKTIEVKVRGDGQTGDSIREMPLIQLRSSPFLHYSNGSRSFDVLQRQLLHAPACT